MTKMPKNNDYLMNGVVISPAVPSTGDVVKIVYDGILAKSGANEIYAHIGFGKGWNGVGDYKMSRSNIGFETAVKVTPSDTLNLCFKDVANNWDNNSGMNYTFDISQ